MKFLSSKKKKKKKNKGKEKKEQLERLRKTLHFANFGLKLTGSINNFSSWECHGSRILYREGIRFKSSNIQIFSVVIFNERAPLWLATRYRAASVFHFWSFNDSSISSRFVPFVHSDLSFSSSDRSCARDSRSIEILRLNVGINPTTTRNTVSLFSARTYSPRAIRVILTVTNVHDNRRNKAGINLIFKFDRLSKQRNNTFDNCNFVQRYRDIR